MRVGGTVHSLNRDSETTEIPENETHISLLSPHVGVARPRESSWRVRGVSSAQKLVEQKRDGQDCRAGATARVSSVRFVSKEVSVVKFSLAEKSRVERETRLDCGNAGALYRESSLRTERAPLRSRRNSSARVARCSSGPPPSPSASHRGASRESSGGGKRRARGKRETSLEDVSPLASHRAVRRRARVRLATGRRVVRLGRTAVHARRRLRRGTLSPRTRLFLLCNSGTFQHPMSRASR